MDVELPPAIALVLNECRSDGRARSLAADDHFMFDLFQQAAYGMSDFDYVGAPDYGCPLDPSHFVLYAGSDLSPLKSTGKCQCVECRLKQARTFARTACLYADTVVLSDTFSWFHFRSDDRAHPEAFALDTAILRTLEPLFHSGGRGRMIST